MLRIAVVAGLVVLATGCVAYRNAAPRQAPSFSAEELSARLPLKIGVHMPQPAEFQSVPEQFERQFRYEMALGEAKRLISTLTACQVVESVSFVESAGDSYDVILMALPRTTEQTGLDDPWLLLYGGAVPTYSKSERGVSFRFLKGGSGDVIFKWTESTVIGLWAPLVSGSSSKWQSSRKSTTYWYDLRSEMLRVFSHLSNE